jgi:hypothetical protein
MKENGSMPLNDSKRGTYFDDQFRRGVNSQTRVAAPSPLKAAFDEGRMRFPSDDAEKKAHETRSPQFVIVDTLRRQLERVITIEAEEGGVSVSLWSDAEPEHAGGMTTLGFFDQVEDAERHRAAVITALVQAARRAGQLDDRRAA